MPILAGGYRCRTGDAKITIGGNLKSKWCIHAVGPDYSRYFTSSEGDSLLASAYANAMERAKENKIQTVAFSLISAGVYRGSQTLEHVLRIGARSISNNLYPGLNEVHMVAYSDPEKQALLKVTASLFQQQPGQ